MEMPPEIVTTSETAAFVYCPESLRLALQGHTSANQSEQVAGTRHHSRKAATEGIASGSIALGRWLILVVLLVLAALWWLNR